MITSNSSSGAAAACATACLLLGLPTCTRQLPITSASEGADGTDDSESGHADTSEGARPDVADDGEDACLDEGPQVGFALDVSQLDLLEIDLPCTVAERSAAGTVTTLGLNCLDGGEVERFELEVELEPGHEVPLQLADIVRFRWYDESSIEWSDRLLRIEAPDGRHVLSGIQGTSLEFTFGDGAPVLPYELDTAPALCDLVDSYGDCISELMAVTFFVEGEPLVLAAHEHAFVAPGTDIWVERAERLLGDDACKGIWAPARYSVLVVGEGTAGDRGR